MIVVLGANVLYPPSQRPRSVWAAGLALWIPLNAWVFLVSQNWSVLLVALPFVVVPTLFFCCLGTVQATRGRTVLGRQP